jgi:hypothetical protein
MTSKLNNIFDASAVACPDNIVEIIDVFEDLT